jgi:small subunit ribosomal protein S5
MSEENKSIESNESQTVPQAPAQEAGSDIVGTAPEKKERASAVIGLVDRGSANTGGNTGGGGHSGRSHGGHGGHGGHRQGRGPRRGGPGAQMPPEDAAKFEKVVHINRCAKVVAGGRRFSFSALVVAGDTEGQVGIGYGKAKEVPECIRKGTEQAKKSMVKIQRKNNTIPHEVVGNHDGGKILLKPAVPGTGVIAGGGVRAVLEAAGIKDVLSKCMGSNNPGAMVFATLDALRQLRSAETIRELRSHS